MPFRDISGHRPLLRLLARAVAQSRLPPSLIFSGPDGVGKRRAAVALAQALNCQAPRAPGGRGGGGTAASDAAPVLDACGACAACRRIARGVHADVLLVVPGESGSIKIDQVREVVERAAYRPFEGRRRVVIVDEADALVAEGQHALLKTLEEPPPASYFVLVTARPDSLLPTVRSRCPLLRFGWLSEAEVAGVLRETHGFEETEARAAAAAGDGSLGRALQAASGELAEARDAAAEVLRRAAGARDPRRRLETAKGLAGKKGAGGVERDQLIQRVRALASLLRDLAILTSRAKGELLANADLRGDLEAVVPAFDSTRTLRAFTAVDRALGALERNASPKVVADWLVFQL